MADPIVEAVRMGWTPVSGNLPPSRMPFSDDSPFYKGRIAGPQNQVVVSQNKYEG